MTCDKSPETVGGGGGGGGVTERKSYGYVDVMTGGGRTYPLTKRTVFVGRDRKCEIRLSNEKVSREHCVLLAEEDDNGNCQMYLLNLTTRLTTFHESRVLDPKEKVRLYHGDRIKLCGTELRYRLYTTGDFVVRPVLSPRDKLKRIVASASEEPSVATVVKPQLDKSMMEVLKVLKAKARKTELVRSSSAPDLISLNPSSVLSKPIPVDSSSNAPLPAMAMRKRGGSLPETDMRKMVLQRCFRRAFRERLSQVSKKPAPQSDITVSYP